MSKSVEIDAVLETTGWTVEELAERLGREERTLKRIMSGEIPLSEKVKTRLEVLSKNGSTTGARVAEEVDHFRPGGARGFLKARREHLEMTIGELAQRSGVQPSTIRNLEGGFTGASERVIELLANALDVTPDALLAGSDMPRSLGSRRTFGSRPDVSGPPGLTARTIPLLSFAEAGALQQWDDVYEHEGIVAFGVKDPKAVAIQIRGDSMEPKYPEGTVAIIYPSYEAKNGDLVIVRMGDGSVMFKRVQMTGDKFTFVSLNPVYPPFTVEKKDVERLVPVAMTQSPHLL
jgi:SOS-response transcriptional repressor LexA